MMAITLEQAKALRYGDVIHSEVNANKDGSCQRWRVSGMVKTWKRNPEMVKVPLKHGLRSYDYLTERNIWVVHLENECPRKED